MDTQTPEQRHVNMAAIRGKDTKPELTVRRWLWSRGFRYRLNSSRLPGHPDLVLRKYRTCIFVNGCFWHGHGAVLTESLETGGVQIAKGVHLRCFRLPKTNVEFWERKIVRNKQRDFATQRQLAAMGWHCITVWECELSPSVRTQTLTALEYTLNHIFLQDHALSSSSSGQQRYSVWETPSEMAAEPSVTTSSLETSNT